MASETNGAPDEIQMDVQGLEREGKLVAFAVDGSEHSLHALQWGLRSVVNDGDKVYLLYVQKFLPMYGLAAAPGTIPPPHFIEAQTKMTEEESRDIIRRAKNICVKRSHVSVESHILAGDARDVICDHLKKVQPDLLVAGSRGLGLVKGIILGSISSYLTSHAPCPVLIVRSSV